MSNPNTRIPNWTAPPNTTGSQKTCTIQVTATDGTLDANGSFGETVNPASSAQFGEERWSVKTGTDPDAHLVNLGAVTPTTIAAMRSLAPPATLPEDNRIIPIETTVWVIDATLTLYKAEEDVDYHLVLQDAAGNTMITEVPSPACVGARPELLPASSATGRAARGRRTLQRGLAKCEMYEDLTAERGPVAGPAPVAHHFASAALAWRSSGRSLSARSQSATSRV